MRKLLLTATLLAGLLLAAGCGQTATAKDGGAEKMATKKPGVIFEMSDIAGDDNGAGAYTYPTDKVFVPGAFDLLGLTIMDGGDTYDFTFTIGTDFKNDWKNALGWDIQLFDVYLNLGTGTHKQTLAGRHTIIAEGWDIALMVGSDKPTRMRREIDDKNEDVGDDMTDFENLVDEVLIPDEITMAGNTLTAKVAKDKIGDLSKLAGVQAFVLGGEGFPTVNDTYNRVVNEYSAQWRFGGGTDYEGDPNVIDMLGDNSALANYKSDEGVSEFPVINLVK